MREETVHKKERIMAGSGDLWIGTKNVLIPSHTARESFIHVGAVDADGFDIKNLEETNEVLTGSPLESIKTFVTKIGLSLSFKFLEGQTNGQMVIAFGYGSLSEVTANLTKSFEKQKVYLYGYNKKKIPYTKMTITEITDNDVTPNVYTGSDITDNFTIYSTEGRLQVKRGGSIVVDNEGKLFYLDGTWEKPKEHILKISAQEISVKDFYSVLFGIPKENNLYRYYFFPAAIPVDLASIVYKAAEITIHGITLKTQKDPSMCYNCVIIDEVSS